MALESCSLRPHGFPAASLTVALAGLVDFGQVRRFETNPRPDALALSRLNLTACTYVHRFITTLVTCRVAEPLPHIGRSHVTNLYCYLDDRARTMRYLHNCG